MNPTPTHTHTASAPAPGRRAGPLAALGLAVGITGLVALTNWLVSSWSDSDWLTAGLTLWAVLFVGCLVLTGTLRRIAGRVLEMLNHWAWQRAQSRARQRLERLTLRHTR